MLYFISRDANKNVKMSVLTIFMRNVKYGKRENVDAGSEYIIMSALTIFIRNVKYGRETKMNAV